METAALRGPRARQPERKYIAAFKRVASGEASGDAATERMYCLRESGEKAQRVPTTEDERLSLLRPPRADFLCAFSQAVCALHPHLLY